MICLGAQNASEEIRNQLLLGSILRENKLFKYTKYKDTLEDAFKEVKKD